MRNRLMWSDEAILLGSASFMAVAACASGAAVYFYFKKGPRYRRRIAQPQPPGNGFDASSVFPRLARVRQDYLAALQHYPHPGFHARGLIHTVRRSIRLFGYFQSRSNEELPADRRILIPPP